MNAQQTRSECKERKVHINSVSFFYVSTKCTYLVDESYDDVARHNVTKKKQIRATPPSPLVNDMSVSLCVSPVFLFIFFSLDFMKRFIHSNDNTTQYSPF